MKTSKIRQDKIYYIGINDCNLIHFTNVSKIAIKYRFKIKISSKKQLLQNTNLQYLTKILKSDSSYECQNSQGKTQEKTKNRFKYEKKSLSINLSKKKYYSSRLCIDYKRLNNKKTVIPYIF